VRERSPATIWQHAYEPQRTRDRVAVLAVLIGALLGGGLVAFNLGQRPEAGRVAQDAQLAVVRPLSGARPASATAAGCTSDRPILDTSFGDLKQRLSNVMGDPGECAHPGTTSGDLLQQTTTGLAIYRAQRNITIFTNGLEHWALASGKLLFWTGPSVDPPGEAQPLGDGSVRPNVAPAPQPSTDDTAVVAGTDGTGVVLRASPRDDDWTPRGFMDGARVQVLERSGTDWVRVRGTNDQEGWVPARYLSQ
jgi:SH3 domain-containing protein